MEEDCWDAEGLLDVKPQTHVVLRDKFISDAVLVGNVPIKTEHSYCVHPKFNGDDENSNDSNSTLQKMQEGKVYTLQNKCRYFVELRTSEISRSNYVVRTANLLVPYC